MTVRDTIIMSLNEIDRRPVRDRFVAAYRFSDEPHRIRNRRIRFTAYGKSLARAIHEDDASYFIRHVYDSARSYNKRLASQSADVFEEKTSCYLESCEFCGRKFEDDSDMDVVYTDTRTTESWCDACRDSNAKYSDYMGCTMTSPWPCTRVRVRGVARGADGGATTDWAHNSSNYTTVDDPSGRTCIVDYETLSDIDRERDPDPAVVSPRPSSGVHCDRSTADATHKVYCGIELEFESTATASATMQSAGCAAKGLRTVTH